MSDSKNNKKHFSEKFIEDVKFSVNLLDFALSLGLQPISGYLDRFPCPWRTGADSNGFQITAASWYDYVTKEHGDCIDFVRRLRGCDFTEAVLELAKYAGMKEPSAPVPAPSQVADHLPNEKQKIVATYDYRDEANNLIFQVVRLEPGRNGKPKEFRQRRMDEKGGWIWNLKGLNRKPLYRLPEWINLTSERIFIVEGEKDVDNLFKLNIKATCNACGAGKWMPNYTEFLKGRSVVIIPDNDGPGKRHVERIVSEIYGHAGSIRILELPDIPEKGDVSDWIEIQRENNLSEEQIRTALMKLVSATSSLSESDIAEIKEQLKSHAAEANRENAQSRKKTGRRGERLTPKEIADAFLLEHNITGKSLYRCYRGMWYFYRENAYLQVMQDDLEADVMAFLRDKFPCDAVSSVRNNVIANLESNNIATIPSYFPFPCWLPHGLLASGWTFMRNCILNVEMAARKIGGAGLTQADVIKEHTPDLFSTFRVDFNYEPDAQCPKFEKFIMEVQPLQEGRNILQLLCGLALVPDTRYEVIFLLYGEAGTGKTTFTEILKAVVGPANVCCLPLNKFTEKHSTHLLTENLLNIVGDLPTSDGHVSLNQIEGILKDVASGGTIPVERKNKDPLTAPAIARCVFASNSLPAFADRSNGIWDRLRIIPFNERFRGTPMHNPHLRDEIIAEELPGIFNWALAGLIRLRGLQRFPEHPEGKIIAGEHRLACDHEREFLSENYEAQNGSYVAKGELYDAYQNFCRSNGYHAKNAANFGREVKRIFPGVMEERIRTETDRPRVWRNITKSYL
ncbi:MAG: hypothetical protein A2017_09975 [Lentisphaerae bacterium GWF2_44_16]|nr:MAG: hypothetical protein A2017_09975 [Lentisphaerae bacterium GWF2_44_16]